MGIWHLTKKFKSTQYIQKSKRQTLFLYSDRQNDWQTIVGQKFRLTLELCWASSLIFAGTDPSFTDEGGGAELRQPDTTGVDAAKIKLELIELQ